MAADRPWPTERTRVHRPSLVWALVLTAGFIAIGIALLPVMAGLAPERVRDAERLPAAVDRAIRFGFPLAFAGLGALGFAAFLRETLRDATFLSAAAGVLPEVPTEPVNDARRFAEGRTTYRFERTDGGWSLVPSHRTVTVGQWAVAVWCFAVWAAIMAILWWPGGAGRPDDFGWRVGMTGVSIPATLTVAAIVWWSMEASRQSMRRLDVDAASGTVRLDGGDPVPRDHLLAVQLCALRIERDSKGPTTGAEGGADAVEVNLVLRPPAGSVTRETLLVNDADFIGAARLAEQLADRLGIPLLNHATEAHRQAENDRSKGRPRTRRGVAP